MKNDWRDIYLIRQTIIEMLHDRKYLQNTTTEELTPDQFQERYPNAITDRTSLKITVSRIDKNDALACHFFDEGKVGLKQLKSVVELYERNINIANSTNTANNSPSVCNFTLMLIAKDSLSPASAKFVESVTSLNLEVFKEKELLFNITKHELVPKHKLLSVEEKNVLLKSRWIREHQLPRILRSDPVAKYFGAGKGDVFMITRKSETAGQAFYYRLVI